MWLTWLWTNNNTNQVMQNQIPRFGQNSIISMKPDHLSEKL